MPQCHFPVFCCFCVSEKLYRKYSQNWTKQKPNIQKFTEACREPKRRRSGATRGPHYRAARPRARPRPLCVWPPWSTSDDAPYVCGHLGLGRAPYVCGRRRSEIRRVQKLFPAPYRRGESPPEVFFIAMLASGGMSE
jgi:hypothetical protein